MILKEKITRFDKNLNLILFGLYECSFCYWTTSLPIKNRM